MPGNKLEERGRQELIPAIRNPGDGASPTARQPSTKNITLTRATTTSLTTGRMCRREPRSEYVTGRTTISIRSVDTVLNGVTKLAYNAR